MFKVHFWFTTTISAIALAFALAGAFLASANGDLREDVRRRALHVQQASQLETRMAELVRTLDGAKVPEGDTQLKDLFESTADLLSVVPEGAAR